MKRLIALLVVAAILAGGAWGVHQLSRARCFALAVSLVCKVDTVRPEVALTFDDGPTQAGVDAVLPVLKQHRAKATFFLVGQEMAKRPDLARRIVLDGHELGNHSWSHRRMVLHTQGFYRDEIRRTQKLIETARGPEDVTQGGFFRPPYGKKLAGLGLAVGDEGLTMVTWNIEEPTTKDPAEYARQVVSQAKPGSIIVIHAMHGANGTARAALPMILEGLRAKGLRMVTVGDMLSRAVPAG